jgi:hypothetical protein
MVHPAHPADTRDIFPDLGALVDQVKNMLFLKGHYFLMFLSASKLGRQSCRIPVS